MSASRHTPVRPVRATRVTPPQNSAVKTLSRPRMVVLVVVMLAAVCASVAAVWYGTQATELRRELERQSLLLDKSVTRLGEREELLSTLVDTDGALGVAHLVSDSALAGVTVYWNGRDGRSMLSAFGLRPLPRERVYALWVGDSVSQRIVTTFNTASPSVARGNATPSSTVVGSDVKGGGDGRSGGANGRVLIGPFRIAPVSSGTMTLFVTVELAQPGRVPNYPALMSGTLLSSAPLGATR